MLEKKWRSHLVSDVGPSTTQRNSVIQGIELATFAKSDSESTAVRKISEKFVGANFELGFCV